MGVARRGQSRLHPIPDPQSLIAMVPPTPRAYLVETIPDDLVELQGSNDCYTKNVLPHLVDSAQTSVDLTAMYWNLLPHPEWPDEAGFSLAQLEALGAGAGRQLYRALERAAARGVKIRILQSPGFTPGPAESTLLQERHPERVQVRQVDMTSWYGSGIMHHKLWIVDGRHLYLGSANTDWRALTQVKELGIAVEEDPLLGPDLERYFEGWWRFADPALQLRAAALTRPLDGPSGYRRPLPAWSPLLPPPARQPVPWTEQDLSTPYNADRPLPVTWNGVEGGAFISGSPPALCGPGRTPDLEALRVTIEGAEEQLDISVMIFLPLRDVDGSRSASWPALVDPLLHAVGRGVRVRLLASRWAYSPAVMEPLLAALQQRATALASASAGSLEVRLFTVPGWDNCEGPGRRYPGHSRTNHPKFVVSERRANIGTSNMTWRGFNCDAGCSLSTTHPQIVSDLQTRFERDWQSPYAHLL